MRRGLVVFLLIAGCASSTKVDPELVAAFPAEGRRWTYEAENEVIIALDRLDEARDRQTNIETEIAALPEPATALEVHAARRQWYEARLEHAEAEVDTSEIFVRCVRASLELTKARLAVNFDLPVEKGFVRPFESRYLSCADELQAAQKKAVELDGAATASKRNWREVRAAYVSKSGDYDHGLWID